MKGSTGQRGRLWFWSGVILLSTSGNVEIKPYRENQCIRIIQNSYASSPADTFPTAETFEAFDRIAYHVRSIINIHP